MNLVTKSFVESVNFHSTIRLINQDINHFSWYIIIPFIQTGYRISKVDRYVLYCTLRTVRYSTVFTISWLLDKDII